MGVDNHRTVDKRVDDDIHGIDDGFRRALHGINLIKRGVHGVNLIDPRVYRLNLIDSGVPRSDDDRIGAGPDLQRVFHESGADFDEFVNLSDVHSSGVRCVRGCRKRDSDRAVHMCGAIQRRPLCD